MGQPKVINLIILYLESCNQKTDCGLFKSILRMIKLHKPAVNRRLKRKKKLSFFLLSLKMTHTTQ